MAYLQLVILLSVWLVQCMHALPSDEHAATQDKHEFDEFTSLYKKQYASSDEKIIRFGVWKRNKKLITNHNTAGLHSYTLGMNQFGDLTSEEYRQTMLRFKANPNRSREYEEYRQTMLRFKANPNRSREYGSVTRPTDIPDTIDWRAKGFTTEVGNQGQCGSCWAFTATGALEGAHKKKTGILVDLSEANLMDCSAKQGNQGCEGGFMDSAFTYVKVNGGIDTEASYPYNVSDPQVKKCKYNPANSGATCTGFKDLQKGNETVLQQAVALIGPIATAVDASHEGFQLYKSGVYDDPHCSSSSIDHSLVVTGYGVEDGKPFWECKNSWGTTWGNHGYIRMVRNKHNQCGIATEASYPTM